MCPLDSSTTRVITATTSFSVNHIRSHRVFEVSGYPDTLSKFHSQISPKNIMSFVKAVFDMSWGTAAKSKY